jgi:small GTP-binding protein
MARLKAVLIGDSAVGKSCIYTQLSSGTYSESHTPTVGGSYASLRLRDSSSQEYTVGLWDTAGQERYKTIIPMYFERADFILAVCALNDRISFEHLSEWVSLARGRAYEHARVIVIANKSDLVQERQITGPELESLVNSVGAVLAIETSAKTAAGLDMLQEAMVRNVPGFREGPPMEVKIDDGGKVDITQKTTETEKGSCC